MKKILLIIVIALFMFQINALSYSVIDAGNSAINRAADWGWGTYVDKNNPANASGKITQVQIYAVSGNDLIDCEVATFFVVSGNYLSTRDTEYIGTVTAGATRTFSVSLNVNSGDYIGLFFDDGFLEADGSGGSMGNWYNTENDFIPCTNVLFNLDTDDVISLYATGETIPNQVTGVAATDGDHTDKVRVTWNAASGADRYYVWQGSSWVNVGLVTAYNHTGAPAPTITAGTAPASDGTSSDYVTLSVADESANNGTSRTYIVKAWNTVGYGAQSTSNTGYRGVGTLTYQWQRSSGDSDADYSNIDGATTDPYNDTGAPENGDGRYFRCVENATGATQQVTNADRGYRIAEEEEEEENAIWFGANF